MSNDQSRSRRKLKFSIDPVRVTPQDSASVKRVMDRLTGRVPFPEEGDSEGIVESPQTDAPGTADAGGISSAQGVESAHGEISAGGTLPAQGNPNTTGSDPARSTLSAQGGLYAQGRKAAQGRKSALPKPAGDVGPSRDFTRVPNSVIRTALAKGLFRGKSRDVYDFLYSKTRGAVVSRVSAQLSRAEIMRGARVGSTHTLRDNLQHLRGLGLIDWKERPGEQGGNEYFVYFPEEARLPFDNDWNPVQVNSPGHAGHAGQNLPRPPSAETAQSAQGVEAEPSTVSGGPHTFLKDDLKTDDEALADLVEALRRGAEEVTGKGTTAAERERWKELGEVLVSELRLLAARTTISSAPAILAEHLRRSRQAAITGPRRAARPPAEAGSPPPTPSAPPADDELINMFVTFLHEGMTVEDLDTQFSSSVEPERWPQIRRAVLERYEAEKRNVRRPTDDKA